MGYNTTQSHAMSTDGANMRHAIARGSSHAQHPTMSDRNVRRGSVARIHTIVNTIAHVFTPITRPAIPITGTRGDTA